jgi:hypothetical protein
MFDVCYPFPGTHTTSALFSELYLQVGSKSLSILFIVEVTIPTLIEVKMDGFISA